jgi:small-conductance mechanosensitive channel
MQDIVREVVANLERWLPSLATALFIFALFWLVAVAIRGVIRRVARHNDRFNGNVLRLVQQIIYVGLLLIGLVTALGTVGVNVAALVTSLGLAGFALGFALKDALSNLISGVLLLLYRPFSVGDEIIVSGFEGRVRSIDLRYTTLQLEGRIVYIPNSKLFTDSVVLKDAEPVSESPDEDVVVETGEQDGG